MCEHLLAVPFLGGAVGARAGLSLTVCPSSWSPALLSSPSQQVRKTRLQWKPRYWWASQRCPSLWSCSPREQQSQQSCRWCHTVSLYTSGHGPRGSSEKLLYLENILKIPLMKKVTISGSCYMCGLCLVFKDLTTIYWHHGPKWVTVLVGPLASPTSAAMRLFSFCEMSQYGMGWHQILMVPPW